MPTSGRGALGLILADVGGGSGGTGTPFGGRRGPPGHFNENVNSINCLGIPWISANSLARSEGFEPPTLGIEIRCSIQLSYERPGPGGPRPKNAGPSRWRTSVPG